MVARGKNKRSILVVGYGSQGRAIALNLKDSGFDVTIGLPSGSKSRRKASRDGFKNILSTAKGVDEAEIICLAFPDHLHGRVFDGEVEPNLGPGKTLWFLHGLSVHFGYVRPPANCDTVLIAPHAPGQAVREKYLGKRDISAFYAIHNNPSGKARETVFNLSRAIGFKKNRLVKTTFKDEALGDLFGEQAILCGGLAALIKNGYEVLIENGIPADNAYLEVAYQLDLIVELIKKHGIEGMLSRISVAARLGAAEAGPKLINEAVRKRMAKIFKDIASGRFTDRLNSLSSEEIDKLNRSLPSLSHPLLEKAAKKFRP